MSILDPEKQRQFALDVLVRLRQAGFEAYLAGGCVRDRLLGRAPKDYDVATNATPPQIRQLFGKRQTLALGASFGVITVRGAKAAGMVEVTTFREDSVYSDGRHPDRVTFSNAKDDASRRNFTVNGLFFDPTTDRVIDYVGGQDDIERRLIRAIGTARDRFAEDKLRMLRAVRFAAAFGFTIESETISAIREMAAQVTVVSAERIAMEMRRMLVEPGRVTALRLLLESGLAAAVLPEIVPSNQEQQERLDRALAALARLVEPGFPLALAALSREMVDPAGAMEVCRRWRLSNKESDRAIWLIVNQNAPIDAASKSLSAIQPILIADGAEDLLALHAAVWPEKGEDIAHCRALLALPSDALDPPPLVTGVDILRMGIPPGPQVRFLLQKIRDAQLDKVVRSKEEAMAYLRGMSKKG